MARCFPPPRRMRKASLHLALAASVYVAACSTLAAAALAAPSAPVPLPAAQVLSKLALTLTGRSPDAASLQAFRAAAAAGDGSFQQAYADKIRTYLADPGFAGQVEAYHSAWWHLPPGDSTHLAAFIVAGNRPYSELFKKNYVYLAGATAMGYRSAQIGVETPLPSIESGYQVVRLAPHETRFRSVLSNPDFLTQFPDTPTNHNRKRSNQIFRTFLCENLVNVTFPGVTVPDVGPHGTDPDCQGCHTRLDPMARFFDQWAPAAADTMLPVFDGAKTAQGRVVIKGVDGRARELGAAGESELAAILLNLPQSRQCVVQKIWEFAMGPNAPLDEATSTHLLEVYGRTDSFKAVLAEVLQHPYFWSTLTPPPIDYSSIKPILAVCAGCHRSRQEPQFDPAQYPLRTDASANVQLLKRMLQAANGGLDSLRMPPPPQPALAPESLAKIRDWIANGALDEHQQPTLTDADIKELLND